VCVDKKEVDFDFEGEREGYSDFEATKERTNFAWTLRMTFRRGCVGPLTHF
jgi:hypothetical protein